jgi:putative addiction module component (TIGR02574 family)
MNIKELIDEVVSLPVEKRVLVVDSLLQNLNRPESGIDKEWKKVAQQRLMEMRSGKIKPIPGEEVFKNIRGKFEK